MSDEQHITPHYPDLQEAIDNLQEKLPGAPESRRELIEKWLQQLDRMQHEMRHLERIESYTGTLKQNIHKDD